MTPVLGGHRRVGVGEQEQPVPVSTHEPVPRPNRLLGRRRSGARSVHPLRRAPAQLVQSSGSSAPVSVATAPPPSSAASAAPKRAVSDRGRGSEDREDTRLPPRFLEAAGCLQLPCQLDRNRLAEPRVSLEQAVERRTGDLEQLRVTHRLHTGRARRAGQEGQLARAQLPGRAPEPSRGALAGDDDRAVVRTARRRAGRRRRPRGTATRLPRGVAALRPPSARRGRSDRRDGKGGRARVQSLHPSER